jgi:hypothetical protein
MIVKYWHIDLQSGQCIFDFIMQSTQFVSLARLQAATMYTLLVILLNDDK